MPFERITTYGETKEQALGRFEWELTRRDIECYPNERKIIDCRNDDTDYNWMVVYAPYGY